MSKATPKFKGKGNHSVNELEKMVFMNEREIDMLRAQRNNFIHLWSSFPFESIEESDEFVKSELEKINERIR
jgi:hypothetical protein